VTLDETPDRFFFFCRVDCAEGGMEMNPDGLDGEEEVMGGCFFKGEEAFSG